MKKGLLLSILFFLIGTQVAVNAQELKVSDVQNSGCLRETRETRAGEYGESRTIILTKEGASLKVQLLNYYSNCGTEGFEVTSNMSVGNNGSPLLLTVCVTPICNVDMDCICPYNVSFTINGVESNSFYFSCWWGEGTVNLTEGEPLVLEDSWEEVSIDGLDYKIHRVMHSAQLTNGKTWEGELAIPSEVRYEGQKYTVINIISSAFSENTALTSVTIPNSIISIGGAAFYGCTGLTSIIIPESVKKIGYYAFKGCTNLANITIPNGVTSIGTDAFTGTEWYNSLPDGVVYIGKIAYTYKGTMPEGTIITIKEGTFMINQEAFSRRSNLVSVTIPSSVTSIGNDAFWKCSGLTSVTISEGVKNIKDMAFDNCEKLSSINIPESVTKIGEFAFRECSSLTSISIPKGVKKIGRCAFEGCKNLISLVISEGIKDLGYMTFSGCYSLSSVTIPGSVTTIGQSVFAGCSGLTSVIISEGVQVIDVGAFEGCNSLTSLTIPSSVATINDYAFYRCSTLTEVKCNALVPPVCYDWVFYDVPLASATLHVPAGSVEKYKAVEPWNGFGKIVAIPENNGIFLTQGTAWVDGFGYEQEEQYKLDDVKLFYYTIVGDTIIADKTYFKICCTKRCKTNYKLDLDDKGNEYIREKELITDDGGLCFFMREDDAGDVWFYTEDKDVFEEISHNTLYEGISESLIKRDLFLFNVKKKYSMGDSMMLGVIAFDSPNGFKEEGDYWDIYPYEVKAVDQIELLDGKIYQRYNNIFLEGVGPLNGPLVGIGTPNSLNADFNQLFAFYRNGQLIYRNEGYLSALEEQFPDILEIITEDKANNIVDIPHSQPHTTNALYDLQGRKMVNGLRKGLYIRDGKKVAVK